tara:strand:- start:136 stop:543 length:408 start_codon:yes stop_codon:yes gene_type:complete
MKKIFYLFILIIGISFSSCKKDEPTCIVLNSDTVEGSWSMMEASLGWGGYQTFEVNQIVWNFNNDNQMFVYLQDSLGINPNIPFSTVNDTSYVYTADSTSIIINDIGYNLSVNETELIIGGNVAVDGTQLTFIRN